MSIKNVDEEQDGRVPDGTRGADICAIQDLAISYGYAIDDGNFERYEALWMPDAHIDYRAAGGIEGTPAEIAKWLPESLGLFDWSLHSVFTHEIRFTGPDSAKGHCHFFARQGLQWEGASELLDVSGLYVDEYIRTGAVWKFAKRTEKTMAIEGGGFAAVLRGVAPGFAR